MAKYRIHELKEYEARYRDRISPKTMDKRYQKLKIEEVGDMVGFATRLAFYAAFFRFMGITPRQYRVDNLAKHPSMVARRK